MTDSGETAKQVLATLDSGAQMTPISQTSGLDLEAGYRIGADIRRLREARGERPVGRKIGFTNAGIWDQYGIHAPIWGYMYETTVFDIADLAGGRLDVSAFPEPRIEPEIMLGLSRAPEPGMDEAALGGCIEWVAHGFEIVKSPFPGWAFGAGDAALFGLHGAYVSGPRVAAAEALLSALPALGVTLRRDGETMDSGKGANVLGGPLTALRHLVGVLANDPDNPPLAAGEIVTTGTMTAAFPVTPGETWQSDIAGVPLQGLELRF